MQTMMCTPKREGPNLGVRFDLDERHIVYEESREESDSSRRQGQDAQEANGVRLDERHVYGDVCARAQPQKGFQDANHRSSMAHEKQSLNLSKSPGPGTVICTEVPWQA